MSDPIGGLVHRYADAVCHFDAAAWEATWAPDGVWDMGGARIEGRDEILRIWVQAMSQYDRVVQVVYNGAVDLDPDTGVGSGRWYIGEFLKPRDDSPKMLLAHYDDDYVLHDGEWVFAERRLRRLYSGSPDLTGEFAGPPS